MRAIGSTRLALPSVVAPVVTLTLSLGLAGCGGSGSTATPGSACGNPTPEAATAVGADHQCVVGVAGTATAHPVVAQVSWAHLRNPILSEPTAGVKDQALVWANGQWHMLFSYVTNDVPTKGAEDWNVASATSPDLVQWSVPSPWPIQAGVNGVASPDIVRNPSGTFVVTYDSNPDVVDGAQSKLYYRTSNDLVQWSAPEPLALSLHPAPGDRMIDAALAYMGHGLILGYKYGTTTGSTSQHFEIVWSPSGSLQGPWTYVGRPDIVVNGDTIENFEFVAAAGRWDLVATSNVFDQPWIFTLAISSDPATASSWLHWTKARMLVIPGQSWDSGPGLSSVGFEHANSVFLCDVRTDTPGGTDRGAGYYYLTYSGSDELTHFGGWGHAEIGIARSTDLVHWQVPG